MPAPEPILAFTSRFESCGVPYFVTGSVASILYGEPRLTLGLDVVLELVVGRVPALLEAFPEERFCRPPREVLEGEASRPQRGHFNLIDYETGFRADVYVAGRDPLHRWAMERRRRYPLGDQALWAAPPEYVIVRKLEFYREGGSEKHLDDVAGMLALGGADFDAAALERWVALLGLQEPWERAKARAPAAGGP